MLFDRFEMNNLYIDLLKMDLGLSPILLGIAKNKFEHRVAYVLALLNFHINRVTFYRFLGAGMVCDRL